ncbi:uncharacterized protein LOC119638665 [Glossina fuscipes]|uniref:Uncharacterized protein LOC119638665 n=1 Tax=Glossina fuscipes TaxID=7396 RepID=A0A9C5Z0C7_9MUSC|nr:uncharacterized protein LOC119638665 [Glossina fuscipes]
MKGIDDLWQTDLVEMISYAVQKNGYRYILTVIDTFSKKAWVMAVKNKNAQYVMNAMKGIFEKNHRKPKNLQTDNGKEFFNNQFHQLMQNNHINHYSTYSVLKASIVERFNRILKGMMWKEFIFQGTYKWIHIYKDLFDKYDNTFHRTMKMTPKQVNSSNEKSLLDTVYSNLKIFKRPKFKTNDYVRISKYKHQFEKGYTPNWTTEIFRVKTIRNTNRNTYLLEDYQGREVKGGFYEYELMKTKFPQTYLVEKVVKRRGNMVYVKWFDNSFTKKEYDSYTSYLQSFKNNDEIRIPIQNQDFYALPSESFLYIEGTASKEDGTISNSIKLLNNCMAHLFDEIRYELNGIEIDRTRHLGITTEINNFPSLNKRESENLLNAVWSPFNNDELTIVSDYFNFCIPLNMLLRFTEDFNKTIDNSEHELILLRSKDNKQAITTTLANEQIKLSILNTTWKMLHVQLADAYKLEVFKKINSRQPLNICFRT